MIHELCFTTCTKEAIKILYILPQKRKPRAGFLFKLQTILFRIAGSLRILILLFPEMQSQM